MSLLTRVARITSTSSVASSFLFRSASAIAPTASRAVLLFRSIGTAAPETKDEMKGSQLAEFDQNVAGLAGFSDAAAEGPTGTMAKPVRIYSSFPSRIVACKGSDNHQHRISWFEMKQGPKHVCTECGQVFQLVTPATLQEAQEHAKQQQPRH